MAITDKTVMDFLDRLAKHIKPTHVDGQLDNIKALCKARFGKSVYYDNVKAFALSTADVISQEKDDYQRSLEDAKEQYHHVPAEVRREIDLHRQVLEIARRTQKDGRRYMQDTSIFNNQGTYWISEAKPLTARGLAHSIQSYADGLCLRMLLKRNVGNMLLTARQGVIYLGHIMNGLADFRSELYREDHNTVPAEHNYDHIEKQILRTGRHYQAVQNYLQKFPNVKVYTKVIAPYGFIDSCGGTYHDLTSADVKFAKSAIMHYQVYSKPLKPQTASTQTKLF